MILYLIQILNFDFPGINLFTYLSFRAGCAIITSLLIVLLIGPKFIKSMLIKQGNGQPIREDGPKSHLINKKGTPTMGGLLILFAFSFSTLLWSRLDNIYVWTIFMIVTTFGAIGLVDDWLKLKKKSSTGLNGKIKLLFQVILSSIAVYYINLQFDQNFAI